MLSAVRASAEAAGSITSEEFARAMAALGPFEAEPHVAVAVSGGADSMALCLLAVEWARARGGRVSALTVDHGLRPDSAAEAAQVGAWLRARGISHDVLPWQGPKPAAGIQSAAREARRALLGEWCRSAGVLHLLLAHHRDDQAETHLLRRERGSGPDGLAAMAAVGETGWGRILRPLLAVPRAPLRALLVERDQPWVEDPTNVNPAFARTALRRRLAASGETAALAAAATGAGRDRARREAEAARLLARMAAIWPEGYCELEPAVLAAAPEPPGRRALLAVLLAVGGGPYPPRSDRFDRLWAAVGAGLPNGGRTLAGCRIVPRRGRILVVRELAAASSSLSVAPGQTVQWDGRFRLRIGGRGVGGPGPWRIAALGARGWAQAAADAPELRRHPMPAAARPSLPALWDLDGVLEVPHLLYRRRSADPDSVIVEASPFRPVHPLAGPVHAIAGTN